MALLGDPGHRRPLALDEHRRGVVLVLLVGGRIARGEDGGEEQHHAEERDAHPLQVSEGRHRPDSTVTRCSCPERESAPRSGQCAAPVPAASASPSRSSEDPFPCLHRAGVADHPGPVPLPLPVSARCRRSLRLPPGRPPRPEGERRRSRRPGPVAVRRPTRKGGSAGAAHWPPRRRAIGESERATEATRRRPISMRPPSPIPAMRMTGSGPAQNSPVCTLVTLGTAAGAAAATGVAAGAARARRGGRGGHGGSRHRGAPRDAHVADVEADAAHQAAQQPEVEDAHLGAGGRARVPTCHRSAGCPTGCS